MFGFARGVAPSRDVAGSMQDATGGGGMIQSGGGGASSGPDYSKPFSFQDYFSNLFNQSMGSMQGGGMTPMQPQFNMLGFGRRPRKPMMMMY